MIKVFVDTDVILDLVAAREPFYSDAKDVFQTFEESRAMGLVCAQSFPNVHYFLRKILGGPKSLDSLRTLRDMVRILPVDEKIVNEALESTFADFEDAIQHVSALRGHADFIVTRNLRDYKKSGIKTLSPSDYIFEINK